MNQTLLSGLVLAGGRSSRMGKDKGLIVYHERPQREHLFNLLSKHCDQVYTSCYDEQGVSPSLSPLVDEYDLKSPVNGILTAFSKHPESAWLIVAVDMPYVDDDTLALLIDNRDQKKVATCFYNSDEKLPEPLLTLWEPTAYPLLLKFIENGNVSPRDFLSTHAVHLVYPPDNKILQNFNFPSQLPSWSTPSLLPEKVYFMAGLLNDATQTVQDHLTLSIGEEAKENLESPETLKRIAGIGFSSHNFQNYF